MFLNAIEARARYDSLVEMLRPFEACWNQSVIQGWPSCSEILPQSWLENLRGLSMDTLYQFDQQLSYGTVKSEARKFLPRDLGQQLADFSALLVLPKIVVGAIPAKRSQLRLSEKKQHELAALVKFVQEQRVLYSWQRGIDIGGGVGHLSREILVHTGLPMISIDQDQRLQTRGRDLLLEDPVARDWHDLKFVNGAVAEGKQLEIDSLFVGSCLSLGLHTCGPLAVHHLKKSHGSAAILNFACCYDRMNLSRDCHLSQRAIELDLPLSTYALFLASRGRQRSLTAFQLQQRANYYRFALHLFLQEEGLASGFVSVGDAPKTAYLGSFCDYAEARCKALGWSEKFQAGRATRFFSDPLVQRSLQDFFFVNILRNGFSRPLEFAVLLDRALWLMEKGRKVAMLEFFEHALSPRNIGIYAI